MKRSERGFTLVELLVVIVIMGILMMVAIPSVTRTIENSRKDTFVDIAKSYGTAVRTLWTSDNLTCEGTVSSAVDDGDYYILINSKEGAKESLPVLVDQCGKSSWGNRDVNGYVRVNISTTAGKDEDGDGTYEVEPKRVTKFYVALSDGTHGLIDDNTLTMDELKRGNVVMSLTSEQLKKTELTADDGRLDCARTTDGVYSCTAVTPIKNITAVCVDDQNNVGVTGRVESIGANFSTDDWSAVIQALKSGSHPYHVGDTKTIDMGGFGTQMVRIVNLSTPSECSQADFSQTACGVVLEFVDIISMYRMNANTTNAGGWPVTDMKSYLNSNVFDALPSVLRDSIINTIVVSGYGYDDFSDFVSIDKLYLLSPKEVYNESLSDTSSSKTRQLDYYNNIGVTDSNYSQIRKKYNDNNMSWWLRSSDYNMSDTFLSVQNLGELTSDFSSYELGVSPAFRIA